MAKVVFEGEKEIEVTAPNISLLEVALSNGINHLHACGGLGRCSVCRVEVLEHPEHLCPRTRQEEKFAEQYGLAKNQRLACQATIHGNVVVRRQVTENPGVDSINNRARQAIGQDIPMAVLFSDIRDFTQISSQMPAHDVIHVLNHYYHMMGETIVRNNGFIHQYYGDGMMALFGFFAR
ncbi:MAG: adenylate/guanylate cyclase domain-containing protein, partial [Deltaproteobacteria bacterium]|nr:adenylate/guanylate cyclase domain-containing protein [Deltaproteobacteria bacterium]